MNIIKDLSFSLKLLPRRLPRVLITSFFVALFLAPAFLFALVLDASFPALGLDVSRSEYLTLLSGDVSSLTSSDLSSAGATTLGAVSAYNGLPFLSPDYLPELSTAESLDAEAAEPVLLSNEDSLDPTLPVYGTFDRVVTPFYASLLAQRLASEPSKAFEPAVAGGSMEPQAVFSRLKQQLSTVVGKTYTEKLSLVLPAEPTTLLTDTSEDDSSADVSLTTNCHGGPDNTNCLAQEPTKESATDCLEGPEGTDCLPAEPESNCKTGDNCIVSEEPAAAEKSVDFYVTYRVVGIAPVYNPVSPDIAALDRALAPESGEIQKITPDQLGLETVFSHGVFLDTPSAALSTLMSEALRTEEYPIVSFSSLPDLYRFWYTRASTHADPSSSDSGIYLAELNSFALPSLGLKLTFTILLVLYLLLFGFIAFLLFNSAKKSFARRNANTFALLHAVRATNFDTRLICFPFRLLLLAATAGWLFLVFYVFRTALFSSLSSSLSLTFFSPALMLLFWSGSFELSLVFGFFTKIFLGALLLIWLLSGLRTRSATSMSRISKYIEN